MKSRASLPPETVELLGSDFAGDVGRFVYPIFSDNDGEPDSVGSGFIVNFNGLHCLITAAHVLDRMSRGETLFWYSGSEQLRRVAGQGILHRLPVGARREDDRIDIGVFILDEPGLPPYPDIGKEVLSGNRLLTHAAPRAHKKFVVLGFPASKADVNRPEKFVRSAAYSYLASSVPAATYMEMGLSEESHIVLPFDTKKIFHLDGRKMNFPKPAGISGAPLWELRRPEEGGPQVVGVMIERKFTRKVMIAADIGFALRLLCDYLAGVGQDTGVVAKNDPSSSDLPSLVSSNSVPEA